MNHIELFAGCGGLSLGLEASGWNLRLANEISEMAAETFAYNLLGTDTERNAKDGRVINAGQIGEISLDQWQDVKLITGDVVGLVNTLKQRPDLVKPIKNTDLVSGGPPCQGFSMAGKREERDPKNSLPYAFVDFVGLVKPKLVLLENVEGILRPFKSKGGTKVPWLEVAKAFAANDYAPIAFLVNARHFRISQNRPRFILIGIRNDLQEKVLSKLNPETQLAAYEHYSYGFKLSHKDSDFISNFNGDQDGIKLSVIDMSTYKSKEALSKHFTLDNLYPEFIDDKVSAKDAISDLEENGYIRAKGGAPEVVQPRGKNYYSQLLSDTFESCITHPQSYQPGIHNHELRNHSIVVRFRFMLIQGVSTLPEKERKLLIDHIKGKDIQRIPYKVLWEHYKNVPALGKQLYIKNFQTFKDYLDQVPSKKQIQRAILPAQPAPAQVTIPDDLCHYSTYQPRVLSVREMARIQSFPDEFVFRSKVTTGGGLRKFEVPQYTQVGNAVPPLLGKSIGQLLMKILD